MRDIEHNVYDGHKDQQGLEDEGQTEKSRGREDWHCGGQTGLACRGALPSVCEDMSGTLSTPILSYGDADFIGTRDTELHSKI
jgi:hypothetical protein